MSEKNLEIPMGVCDSPQTQSQPIFYLNLHKANIAIFGGPMSGKTTFIKTLLFRLAQNIDYVPREDVYIIDFGGNIGKFGKLKNVCACVDSSNEESVKRIFRTIETRLVENAEALESNSFYTLELEHPEKCPNHMTLIIDNLSSFIANEKYSFYQESLIKFARDGLSKGLTVIVTANDLLNLNRLLSYFGQRIAFEMPADSYYDIFNSKVVKPMKTPGRGIVSVESNNYEFQAFLPYEKESDYNNLVETLKYYENRHLLRDFPKSLTQNNLKEYNSDMAFDYTDSNQVVVGLDYYDFKQVTVDLQHNHSIGIYSRRGFGNIELVKLLLKGIRNRYKNARFVFFDDGREELLCMHDKNDPNMSEYFTEITQLQNYLPANGYGGRITNGQRSEYTPPTSVPPTVFVLHSKAFYSTPAKNLCRDIVNMAANADQRKLFFIFSDIRKMTDSEQRSMIQDTLTTAFLLDDFYEFVTGRGSNSVFSDFEISDYKNVYAKCSKGDGFLYDITRDKLNKLKFIEED